MATMCTINEDEISLLVMSVKSGTENGIEALVVSQLEIDLVRRQQHVNNDNAALGKSVVEAGASFEILHFITSDQVRN